MKAYGVGRNLDLIYPDVGDIATYGLKSSVGHLRGPGGDIRSSFKNPSAKARIRRRFKRAARAENRRACAESV